MAVEILLLRHAQSTWNADGRWQGWADPPLSEAGELAAREAAGDPTLDPIAAVASSDLQRARRTAEVIARIRGLDAPATFRGLRERGAGDWTGLTRPEIHDRWPGALDATVADIPGGERPAAVTARAVATLHRLAERWPAGPILAVTHGALIRLVEAHAGGEAAPIRNLGGRWVVVHPNAIELGQPVHLQPTTEAVTELAG